MVFLYFNTDIFKGPLLDWLLPSWEMQHPLPLPPLHVYCAILLLLLGLLQPWAFQPEVLEGPHLINYSHHLRCFVVPHPRLSHRLSLLFHVGDTGLEYKEVQILGTPGQMNSRKTLDSSPSVGKQTLITSFSWAHWYSSLDMGLWETSSPSRAPMWATLPFLPKSSLSHGSHLSSLNNQMTP